MKNQLRPPMQWWYRTIAIGVLVGVAAGLVTWIVKKPLMERVAKSETGALMREIDGLKQENSDLNNGNEILKAKLETLHRQYERALYDLAKIEAMDKRIGELQMQIAGMKWAALRRPFLVTLLEGNRRAVIPIGIGEEAEFAPGGCAVWVAPNKSGIDQASRTNRLFSWRR